MMLTFKETDEGFQVIHVGSVIGFILDRNGVYFFEPRHHHVSGPHMAEIVQFLYGQPDTEHYTGYNLVERS